MARAYSDDLREKVLGAYASGKGTLQELAGRFDVSYGWVAKIHAVELSTGQRHRVPQRRRPSSLDRECIRGLVKQKPDIVLRELQQEMLKAGQRVRMAARGGIHGEVPSVFESRSYRSLFSGATVQTGLRDELRGIWPNPT